MSFTTESSSVLRLIADAGLGGGGPRIWEYASSNGSTECGNITGYFAGQGACLDLNYQGGNPVGMAVGDLVIVRESTAGAVNGRCTIHAVSKSSANSTLATYVSTGGYDVTISQSCTG